MTLTPGTANPVERRLDGAAGDRLGRVPARLPMAAWDVDALPVAWLPVLAWALSVDVWNPAWSVSDRRQAIRAAITLHREKGTCAAVKRVLDACGAIYDYSEPAPFTCRIALHNSASLHGETIASLTAARAGTTALRGARVNRNERRTGRPPRAPARCRAVCDARCE